MVKKSQNPAGKPAATRKSSPSLKNMPYDLRPAGARIKGRVGAPRSGLFKPERKIYLNRCRECNDEFPSFRRGAIFCGPKCRQKACRRKMVYRRGKKTARAVKKGGQR